MALTYEAPLSHKKLNLRYLVRRLKDQGQALALGFLFTIALQWYPSLFEHKILDALDSDGMRINDYLGSTHTCISDSLYK